MNKIIRDLNILDKYLRQGECEMEYLIVISQNKELKDITEHLLKMDELYKEISSESKLLLATELCFDFEENIIDKIKYKEYYDKRISGRDLRIFLTYTVYYLEKLEKGELVNLRKQYKDSYKTKHIPYGLSIAIKYLKYLKM